MVYQDSDHALAPNTAVVTAVLNTSADEPNLHHAWCISWPTYTGKQQVANVTALTTRAWSCLLCYRLVQQQAEDLAEHRSMLQQLAADRAAALAAAERQAAAALQAAEREHRLALQEAQQEWERQKAALEAQRVEAVLQVKLCCEVLLWDLQGSLGNRVVHVCWETGLLSVCLLAACFHVHLPSMHRWLQHV